MVKLKVAQVISKVAKKSHSDFTKNQTLIQDSPKRGQFFGNLCQKTCHQELLNGPILVTLPTLKTQSQISCYFENSSRFTLVFKEAITGLYSSFTLVYLHLIKYLVLEATAQSTRSQPLPKVHPSCRN